MKLSDLAVCTAIDIVGLFVGTSSGKSAGLVSPVEPGSSMNHDHTFFKAESCQRHP
jgi:hypothetical protein